MWKLLYIFMLGYEVDFGHMQVIGLISATKFAEKQVGYTATSVLLNETHEFLRLVINSVREDIIGRHESHQCLALSFVANVGGREFADSLAADVQVVLTNSAVRPIVRKKAALALLRLFRRNREILLPETFAQKMLNLLDERDLGILTGVISLLTGIVSHDYRGYEACIPKVCDVMNRLARNKDVPLDYLYYALPSPWLQVKCMRVLQYYPTPEDPEYRQAETDVIHQILTGTNMVRNVNKNNALHSVLFEAVNLANMLDLEDRTLLTESIETLGSFVEMEEPNIVYLGLQYLTKMVAPDTLEAIKQYESLVVTRLHHGDISIRRRALDLLYAMCDGNNAKQIVGHLLTYMITADFNIREELALKTAILAERYSGGSVQNKRWFLDVSLALIEKAGDYVSDAHWHRVVQIVTNAPELHEPAARESLARLRDGASHDMFVKLAAYLLGEFGHALAATERPSSYASILMAMHERVGTHAREIILSALAKMCMHAGSDEALRKMVGELFKADASTAAVELQQRAVEYYVMTNTKDYHATLRSVMDQMPEFPNRESKLEKNLEEAVGETADAAVVKRDRVAATATAVIAANRWRAGRGGGGRRRRRRRDGGCERRADDGARGFARRVVRARRARRGARRRRGGTGDGDRGGDDRPAGGDDGRGGDNARGGGGGGDYGSSRGPDGRRARGRAGGDNAGRGRADRSARGDDGRRARATGGGARGVDLRRVGRSPRRRRRRAAARARADGRRRGDHGPARGGAGAPRAAARAGTPTRGRCRRGRRSVRGRGAAAVGVRDARGGAHRKRRGVPQEIARRRQRAPVRRPVHSDRRQVAVAREPRQGDVLPRE